MMPASVKLHFRLPALFTASQRAGFSKSHAKSRSGFTLLEMILAVGLTALLISLIGAGMRIYTNIVAERRADVANAQVARFVLDRIANDLRASYTAALEEDAASLSADAGVTATGETEDGATETDASLESEDLTVDLTGSSAQQVPGIYGNEFELQVDVFGQFAKPIRYDMLTAAGSDPFTSNLLSDPKVITYYTRAMDASELAGTVLESVDSSLGETKSILIRRIQSRAVALNSQASGMSDMQAGEQLLSSQVFSIQFAYHDGYDWLSSWDTSLIGELPVAVSITVTIIDDTADAADNIEINGDNTFQKVVRIPTASLPEEDSTTGI